MTTGGSAHQDREDLFVADFYPELGEYLAGQHASGYDAEAGHARFLAWLGERTDAGAAVDPVRDYLEQIGTVPPLDAEKEAELARRIKDGRDAEEKLAAAGRNLTGEERIELEGIAADGAQARNHLLEANLRLVASLAKRYTGRGMLYLDLIQEGNLGLIKAVEKFDYAKGYRFRTYSTWWIRQAMTRAIANQAGTIRIPVHMVEALSKLSREQRQMRRDLGREPTPEELASEVQQDAREAAARRRRGGDHEGGGGE